MAAQRVTPKALAKLPADLADLVRQTRCERFEYIHHIPRVAYRLRDGDLACESGAVSVFMFVAYVYDFANYHPLTDAERAAVQEKVNAQARQVATRRENHRRRMSATNRRGY